MEASIDHAKQAVAASEDAYKLINMRYTAGLSNYLQVLTDENTLVASRRDCSMRSCKSAAESIGITGFAPLRRGSSVFESTSFEPASFEPGAEKKFV